jgi:sterol 3beta-glucosyltransferase
MNSPNDRYWEATLTTDNRFLWPSAHLRNFRRKPAYRFAVLDWGTRGDVQPFIALGTELVRRGHQVVIAARAPFRPLIEEQGIEFFGMEEDGTDDLMRSLAACKGVPDMLKTSASYSRGLIGRQCRSFWEASRWADAVLTKVITTAPAVHVAEGRGVPVFLAHFDLGFLPTGSYCFLDGRIQDRGRMFNRFMARFLLLSMALSFSDRINVWRLGKGLPMDSLGRRNRSTYLSQFPAFAAWSPHFLSRPPDWPEWVVQTGWWRMPGKPAVSRRLREFVEAGPPPVYFGYGSWEVHDKPAVTDMLLEVARATGNRAILLRKTVDDRTEFPQGVLVEEELPYDWLFPHLKAVVHHGGSGTSGAAIHAGVPSIVIPAFPAQAAWGHLVEEKGIGAILEQFDLRADRLAAALREVEKPAIRERAGIIGEAVRNDGGVQQAADEIERRLWEATTDSRTEPILRLADVHPTFTSKEYIEGLPSPDPLVHRRIKGGESAPEDSGEGEG